MDFKREGGGGVTKLDMIKAWHDDALASPSIFTYCLVRETSYKYGSLMNTGSVQRLLRSLY